MKRTYRITPCYTGDVSGACSALYELGGMTVIHDPSGCNSTYNTHDETRWYDQDSLIFISGFSERDALMGGDEKFVREVCEAALSLRPAFIALLCTPIPWISGTDFRWLAKLIEKETSIRTFYVPTNSMHDYVKGAAAAFEALTKQYIKTAGTSATTTGMSEKATAADAAQIIAKNGAERPLNRKLNILGVTPLDFAGAGSADSLRRAAEQAGWTVQSCWAMGSTLSELSAAAEASVNLVVSATGMSAAKLMEQQFGIPFVAGTPVGKTFSDRLWTAVEQAAQDRKSRVACLIREDCGSAASASGNVIVIGEPVTMGSLASEISLLYKHRTQLLCPLEADSLLLSPADVRTAGEENIEQCLKQATGIIADPLYRPIAPEGIPFYNLPHQAFSGRSGWKEMHNLMELPLE